MNREELNARILKLTKLRLLFLLLGIFLIIGGVVIVSIMSWNSNAGTITFDSNYSFLDAYQEMIEQFSDPKYLLLMTLSSLMLDGGIVLLILRAALLGRKLKKARNDLIELNNHPVDDGIDRSMWR